MFLSRFFNAIIILCFLFVSFNSAHSKEFNSYIIKYSDNADVKAYAEQLNKHNVKYSKAFAVDLNNAKIKNDKLFSDATRQLADNIELFYMIPKDEIESQFHH
jgi:hypothetical protein